MSQISYQIGVTESGVFGPAGAVFQGGNPNSALSNGLTIDLSILKTNDFIEEPIFSELGEYMYTKFTLDVDTVYNPRATTASRNGVAVDLTSPVLPGKTDEALRHFLMLPQGKVVYRSAGVIQFESPLTSRVDANNGPRPVYCHVRANEADKSYLVTWRVESWLNESWKYNTTGIGPLLISHNWSQTETLDDQYYAVRVTNGRCIFDMSRMPANQSPDDFRLFLLPALPISFKRDSVQVTAAENGTTLYYTCVDRELRVGLGEKDITKVECLDFGETCTPDITTAFGTNLQALGSAAISAYAAGVTAARAATALGATNRVVERAGWVGLALSAVTTIASGTFSFGRAAFGTTVRVYGNKRISMSDLQFHALRIVAHRLTDDASAARPGRFVHLADPMQYNAMIRIAHNAVAGYVEVTKIHSRTLAGTSVATVGATMHSLGNDLNSEGNRFVHNDGTRGADGASVPPNSRGPSMGSRGFYLGRVLSQRLRFGNVRFPLPHNTPDVGTDAAINPHTPA